MIAAKGFHVDNHIAKLFDDLIQCYEQGEAKGTPISIWGDHPGTIVWTLNFALSQAKSNRLIKFKKDLTEFIEAVKAHKEQYVN